VPVVAGYKGLTQKSDLRLARVDEFAMLCRWLPELASQFGLKDERLSLQPVSTTRNLDAGLGTAKMNQELIGKIFNLSQAPFRIVDVRNVGGAFMVYAEPQNANNGGVARRAFRFDDIAHLVAGEPSG